MKSAASLRLPPKFFNPLDYKGFGTPWAGFALRSVQLL
jgi:hypothetical protein